MPEQQEWQGPAWAIVEIMGHRQVAGRISEVTRFGAVFCRVEIDQPDGSVAVQDYGGSSIFCVTQTDEATVRKHQGRGTYAGPLVIEAVRTRSPLLEVEDDGRDDDRAQAPPCIDPDYPF